MDNFESEILETVAKEFEELREKFKVGGDRDNGRIEIFNRRFNVMGSEYWCAGFYRYLKEVMGEAGIGIIYRSGFKIGGKHYRILSENYYADNWKLFGKYLGFLKFCGYGDIKSYKDEETVYVTTPNSPDSEEWIKRYGTEEKVCHYLSGLLAGFLSSLKDDKIDVEEVECRAEGKEQCVFRVKEQ